MKDIITSSNEFKRLSSNNLFHANILIGNDSAYLKQFCLILIAERLKKSGKELIAKKVLNESLIDLQVFEGTETLKVEDISNIVAKVSEKGLESEDKFCIICNAERIGIEAQNKLLKTLEEPPFNQYFFLICPSMFSLLPTVVSRCAVTEISQYSKDNIKLLLDNANKPNSKIDVEKCFGRIEDVEKFNNEFEFAKDALMLINKSSDCAKYSSRLIKLNILKVTEFIEQMLVDSLKIKFSCSNIWFESLSTQLKSLCSFNSSGVIFIYNQLERIKQLAKVNVSQTVLADMLVLAIAEGKNRHD